MLPLLNWFFRDMPFVEIGAPFSSSSLTWWLNFFYNSYSHCEAKEKIRFIKRERWHSTINTEFTFDQRPASSESLPASAVVNDIHVDKFCRGRGTGRRRFRRGRKLTCKIAPEFANFRGIERVHGLVSSAKSAKSTEASPRNPALDEPWIIASIKNKSVKNQNQIFEFDWWKRYIPLTR